MDEPGALDCLVRRRASLPVRRPRATARVPISSIRRPPGRVAVAGRRSASHLQLRLLTRPSAFIRAFGLYGRRLSSFFFFSPRCLSLVTHPCRCADGHGVLHWRRCGWSWSSRYSPGGDSQQPLPVAVSEGAHCASAPVGMCHVHRPVVQGCRGEVAGDSLGAPPPLRVCPALLRSSFSVALFLHSRDTRLAAVPFLVVVPAAPAADVLGLVPVFPSCSGLHRGGTNRRTAAVHCGRCAALWWPSIGF